MAEASEIPAKVSNTVPVVYSPREAILHSANLLRSTIHVQGTVVLVDRDLGRMDLVEGGAKLITRLPAALTGEGDDSSLALLPPLDKVVIVSGVLRKEQRRTFLMVSEILPPAGGESPNL